jgi:hypothetical protein
MRTTTRNSTPTARTTVDDRRVCSGATGFPRRPTGSVQPVWISRARR